MKGKVIAVNISEIKGVPKENIGSGAFKEGHGLIGDAHAGSERQVSLLAKESIDKMTAIGVEGLKAGSFGENLTTEGLNIYELPLYTVLRIGETIQRITKIGKECHTGCAIKQKVGKCIMPVEGIFTEVIKGGKIASGDEISVVSDYEKGE